MTGMYQCRDIMSPGTNNLGGRGLMTFVQGHIISGRPVTPPQERVMRGTPREEGCEGQKLQQWFCYCFAIYKTSLISHCSLSPIVSLTFYFFSMPSKFWMSSMNFNENSEKRTWISNFFGF